LQKQSIENDSKKAPHSVWSFEGAECNVESELFKGESFLLKIFCFVILSPVEGQTKQARFWI